MCDFSYLGYFQNFEENHSTRLFTIWGRVNISVFLLTISKLDDFTTSKSWNIKNAAILKKTLSKAHWVPLKPFSSKIELILDFRPIRGELFHVLYWVRGAVDNSLHLKRAWRVDGRYLIFSNGDYNITLRNLIINFLVSFRTKLITWLNREMFF